MIPGDWHHKCIRSRHAALNQGVVKETGRAWKDRQTYTQSETGTHGKRRHDWMMGKRGVVIMTGKRSGFKGLESRWLIVPVFRSLAASLVHKDGRGRGRGWGTRRELGADQALRACHWATLVRGRASMSFQCFTSPGPLFHER